MKTRAIAATTTMIGACLAFSQASVKAAPGVPLGFTIPKKTLSPDGRYGVIVPNLDHYDDRRTQNELVESASGRFLAVIRGETGFENMKHGGPAPVWTSDGTGLLWIVQGKWFPRAVNYLKLADGIVIWQTNLLLLAQQEILRRTQTAAPAAYAAAVFANKGSGSGFPDGFTINLQLPMTNPVLPLNLLIDLTANPKGIGADRFVPQGEIYATMLGVLQADGSLNWSDFKVWTGTEARKKQGF